MECKLENCGAGQILRTLPTDFTGRVEINISNGVVGTVKVIQSHPREELIELAMRIQAADKERRG